MTPMQPPDKSGKDGGDKIDKTGVLSNLGRIHENIKNLIKSKKFKENFGVKYNRIQATVKKQLRKTDKGELDINEDLEKTKAGIKDLKRPMPGNWLLRFIFGGKLAGIMFTIAGGILLITLARMAWSSWKKNYMPETEPTTYTILGIPIPGVS